MDFFCYKCNQETYREICKCGSVTEWLFDYDDLEDNCNHEGMFDFGDGAYCSDCGEMMYDSLLINDQKIYMDINREGAE